MSDKGHHIVVIGTSAGGLEAVDEVIGGLPSHVPASFFIVQHMAPENTGIALLRRLSKHNGFTCKMAIDGETFKPGTIYIAPADYHLLVKEKTVLVTKGARENRYRPAVDPLFRSAAVTHGASVIGIVLTGMLDDGSAGLGAIKKCGGITVVQDPKDATYPEMPQSALNNVEVDHCVPLSEMGGLLDKLIHTAPGQKRTHPERHRDRGGDCRTNLERCRASQRLRCPGPIQLPELRRCFMEDGRLRGPVSLPHGAFFHRWISANKPVRENRGDALGIVEDVRRTQKPSEQYGSNRKSVEGEKLFQGTSKGK